MKHNTAIEWTHIPGFKGETWNPIVGCSIASKGCTNCYAMRTANVRLDGNPKTPHYAGTTKKVNDNPVWTGKVALASEKTLLKPLSWSKPRSIFVNSMGDLFHEDVPDEWIDQVFAIAALCPQHIFIILTKRAVRMQKYCKALGKSQSKERINQVIRNIGNQKMFLYHLGDIGWQLPNVWLGVSTEDQATADERIPYLLSTPAAVRFLSCEPLLGKTDLTKFDWSKNLSITSEKNVLSGDIYISGNCGQSSRTITGRSINWVIAGGESGPNARPMHPDWARSLRDQCQAANVPFFFKQWGEWASCTDLWNKEPSETYAIDKDGRLFAADGPDYTTMKRPLELIGRFGKARTGHLLDDVEHFNWPESVKVLEGVEA